MLIAAAAVVILTTATAAYAQSVNQQWHPHGFPPGIPGTYNNPIRVHAALGEQVTLGDFSLGLDDPWYVVAGWWDNPQQTGASGVLGPYYDLFGHHHGQFLTKMTVASDYNYADHGVIYAVAAHSHGFQFVFFMIVPRSHAADGNLEP